MGIFLLSADLVGTYLIRLNGVKSWAIRCVMR